MCVTGGDNDKLLPFRVAVTHCRHAAAAAARCELDFLPCFERSTSPSATVASLEEQWLQFKQHPAIFVANNINFFNLLCISIGVNIGILSLAALSNIVRWKRRGKSDYDFFLPFVLGWLGSILWSLYGYFACNWHVIAVNGPLSIVNSVVLICLIIYRIRKRTVIIFTSLVAMSVGLLIMQLSRMPSKVSANVVGTICSTLQILCALTMIYVINRAISKQRIDFVPFPPVAQIFNIELQVSIYSVMVKDYYLLISNGIFMLIDGMVFALFFIYPSDVAEKKQKPERKLIEA